MLSGSVATLICFCIAHVQKLMASVVTMGEEIKMLRQQLAAGVMGNAGLTEVEMPIEFPIQNVDGVHQ